MNHFLLWHIAHFFVAAPLTPLLELPQHVTAMHFHRDASEPRPEIAKATQGFQFLAGVMVNHVMIIMLVVKPPL